MKIFQIISEPVHKLRAFSNQFPNSYEQLLVTQCDVHLWFPVTSAATWSPPFFISSFPDSYWASGKCPLIQYWLKENLFGFAYVNLYTQFYEDQNNFFFTCLHSEIQNIVMPEKSSTLGYKAADDWKGKANGGISLHRAAQSCSVITGWGLRMVHCLHPSTKPKSNLTDSNSHC